MKQNKKLWWTKTSLFYEDNYQFKIRNSKSVKQEKRKVRNRFFKQEREREREEEERDDIKTAT